MAKLDSHFDVALEPNTSAADATRRFERQAGVYVEAIDLLRLEILGDLDPLRFGVGWWAPHPDDKRRIFISDYLLQAVASVSQNLLDGALHLLEAETAQAAASERMARSIVVTNVGPVTAQVRLDIPASTSLRDLLSDRLRDLHVAGAFRAIGSVFDVLAAVIVGVGAFEARIAKMGYRDLRNLFNGILTLPAQTIGDQFRGDIARAFTDAVAAAGPDGWLEWAIEYRNMLVHRARRMTMQNVIQDGAPAVVDIRGVPVMRAKTILHLARDPRNSDLQAFFSDSPEPNRPWNLLQEDGLRALRGILEATVFTVTRTAEALLGVWRGRRQTPSVLIQPAKQWPDTGVRPARFSGFEPDSIPAATGQLHTSQTNVERLRAAALDTGNRHRWRTFTGS